MLHSFNYGPGERAFRDVLAQDPSCAIATGGIAALLMNNPLASIGPPKEWAERAQAAIDEGRKIGAKTARERDYIEAVAAYYEDGAKRPERTRQQNRAKAFEALAARYPADDEAQIFYALYLASTQSLTDQPYKAYLTAADILEKQFVKHPDHPGVAHYLIHSYDAPPIAAKGVPAARRYASIAPAAPHALHMPSHIFTRVGLWTESAETNARSAASARRDGDGDEQAHAMDYMGYAYLQLARGQSDDALALMRSAADAEDRSEKHIVTPGRILPARELLGDMLLELKRPAEALKEFETAQLREPGRFRGYAGAARAAIQSGDRTKARHYYVKLVDMAGAGDARPDLTQARAFLAANP